MRILLRLFVASALTLSLVRPLNAHADAGFYVPGVIEFGDTGLTAIPTVLGLEEPALDGVNTAKLTLATKVAAKLLDAGASCPDSNCYPQYWSPTTYADRQHQANTCGPSSTRFALATYNGGPGYFEEDYYGLEGESNGAGGTNGKGTDDGSVAYALNHGVGHVDTIHKYQQGHPASSKDLYGYVISDTYYDGESVVAAVRTDRLGYWQNAQSKPIEMLYHFNSIYGYDMGGQNVTVFDEYDYPLKGNGVDPYGYHFVNVNAMVLAIQSNDRGTKDVVLW